jgi:hypothetical protein
MKEKILIIFAIIGVSVELFVAFVIALCTLPPKLWLWNEDEHNEHL